MDVLGGSQIYVYVCNFHGHWSVTELYNCVWMVLAGSSSTRVYIVHFTVKGAAIDTVACLMWPSAEVARRRSKVNDRPRVHQTPHFFKNVLPRSCHQNLIVTYPKTIHHVNFEVHLNSSRGSASRSKFPHRPCVKLNMGSYGRSASHF